MGAAPVPGLLEHPGVRMSDHIIARQSTVVPATHAGRGRRKATTVVGAALGALVLAGGGFLAGAAIGHDAGMSDDASDAAATEAAYDPAFFGSLSPSGSSSLGGAQAREDAPADRSAGAGAGTDGEEKMEAESASPEAGASTGSSGRTGYAVQGDVIEIEGENVLVCATGNGLGLSHIGVTLEAGADGEATRAQSEHLCSDAFRLTGALLLEARGDELLSAPRDVNAAGHAYQCRPAAEKVLRCTAEDGTIVTLWSAAP